MQLKRVELQGFKSFADKTNIEFLEGITTIVGPNGSGKSNVSDAIRWVLGEQSAKSLRGSNMQDIIFAGTEQRKMQGLAEVTLVLDNSDSSLPLEYNEVAVTRRVYRSGESEYYINKSVCRLKDIQELFMDTGVGRDGYSIIGQGKIDEILSTKSEERRSIFEEASGITKYRTRKEEAVRKLDHTNENLTRVRDIILEIENTLGPLEEKSKTAKKYLEFREELKKLEVRLFINMFNGTEDELNRLTESINALNENVSIKQKQIEQLEENRDKNKVELERILLDIEKGQEKYFTSINELEKVKNRIDSFSEKNDVNKDNIQKLEQEIEEHSESINALREEINRRNQKKENMISNKARFEEELDEKENELKEITANMDEKQLEIEDIKRYIETLKEKLTEYKVEVSSLESTMEANSNRVEKILKENTSDISSSDSIRIAENEKKDKLSRIKKQKLDLEAEVRELELNKTRLEQNISEYDNKESSLKQKILELRSKVNYLVNLENESEGYIKSVKSILDRAKQDNKYGIEVYGTMGTLITTDEKYERAIEIALGGYVQNIVVENDNIAKDAISYLKQNSLRKSNIFTY